VREEQDVARALGAVDDRIVLGSIQIKGLSAFAQHRMNFRAAARPDPIVLLPVELAIGEEEKENR